MSFSAKARAYNFTLAKLASRSYRTSLDKIEDLEILADTLSKITLTSDV